MPNFAVIKDGLVDNIVVADDDYAASQGWTPLPHGVGPGWEYKDGQFIAPVRPTAELAADARLLRDQLLASTDWTQMPDVPQATKDKWASYRQALRDVPQQAGFPDNIQWPVKPE